MLIQTKKCVSFRSELITFADEMWLWWTVNLLIMVLLPEGLNACKETQILSTVNGHAYYPRIKWSNPSVIAHRILAPQLVIISIIRHINPYAKSLTKSHLVSHFYESCSVTNSPVRMQGGILKLFHSVKWRKWAIGRVCTRKLIF